MHRTLLAVLTTLLLGGAAMLSCNDRSGGPSDVDDRLLTGSVTQAEIQELIDAIFGRPGGLLTAANSQWKAIKKACQSGPTLSCQSKVLNLVDFTGDKLAEDKLKASPTCSEVCPGTPPVDTTPEAALLLQLFLLEYGGFDVPAINPGDADATDTVIVICNPGQTCLARVADENGKFFSGVFLPIGACDGQCVIIGQRIDETVFDPTTGPLSELNGGDLDQFPLFFSWSKQELGEGGGGDFSASRGLRLAQGDFNVPVEIALCVVEEGPYAPPDEDVEARLQLAHPNPADPDTIEILDVNAAANVDLDCSDASAGDPPSELLGGLAPAGERRLTLASPGKLGAAILAFSPFAAVDPQSGEVQTGSIAGTVSGCFAIGVSGAFVELFEGTIDTGETPYATTTTAANGSYSFTAVPVGSYTARASAATYNPTTATVTVSSGQESTANIQLTGGVCIG